MIDSIGTLGVAVWPTYVSAIRTDGTPSDRAQITWKSGDLITGIARLHLPAGDWTHLAYWRGPGEDHAPAGDLVALPHPFRGPGVLDLDPIVCD